jgi:hypothetical protein
MDPALIFAKTDKGREEIEKRTYRIDFKRRTLLIVIDGQSDAKTLASKTTHLGDTLALLQSLWEEGFIAPTGEFAGLAAVSAVEEKSPAPAAKSLKEMQHSASRAIEKLMGPAGEGLALKLERTSTAEAFLAEAQKTRDTLRSSLGARKAEEFWKALGF